VKKLSYIINRTETIATGTSTFKWKPPR